MNNTVKVVKNQSSDSSDAKKIADLNKSLEQQQILVKAIYNSLPNMPAGITKIYHEIVKSENKLRSLDEQIDSIKEKLKPISKIEKSRGKRKDLPKGNVKLFQGSLKRLEQQRFLERDNWSGLMKKFSDIIGEDSAKVRNEFTVSKARSFRYVARNKILVIRKCKKLLDNSKNDVQGLTSFKNDLQNRDPKKVIEAAKNFLEKNDSEKFLSAAYQSHESLRGAFNELLKNLLNEWSPKAKNFEFSNVTAEFNISQPGVKK